MVPAASTAVAMFRDALWLEEARVIPSDMLDPRPGRPWRCRVRLYSLQTSQDFGRGQA